MSQLLPKFKKELAARELPIDTEELQLESLYDFAGKLGYKILGSYSKNQGFHNPHAEREALKFISFDTMKHYHNNPFDNYIFTHPNVAAAAVARIVEKVKLQQTKRGIKVQNHYVKLVTKSREDYLKSLLAEACPTLKQVQLEQLADSGLFK